MVILSKAIGIDLGTTNSCISVVEVGEPQVIVNPEGNRTTPSVVAFSKDGERLVGQPAKRQAVINPERTVTSIKRKMGTRDATTIDGKDYSPEEISAMILGRMKKAAEDYLGEDIKDAVITVPAYFDDSQRKATKDAGEIAGLNVLRIINEPTAASLAYGAEKQKLQGTILVYDLGGGTFDVSILDVEVDKASKESDYFEVLSTSGDTKLGGDDFDNRLVDYICDEFKKDVGIDLRNDRQALQRVKEAAEKAKVELSSTTQTNISLPFITNVEGEGPKHLELNITRAKFEGLVQDLIDRTEVSVNKALEDAGLKADDISKVLLVGGSTRIPKVQENLVKRFGESKLEKGLNPDEVVALGASIQANILAGNGSETDLVLVDVTPLTLGIETLGDVYDILIERNTSIPTKQMRIYSTATDNQPGVEIHVLQGERKRASQNKTLGRFHLTGLPPAPRGVPQIEVTFDLNANGILEVNAKDKATGREQSITITGSGQLSEDEIKNMVEEAEKNKEEDSKFEELAKTRNMADSLINQTKQTLEDLSAQISEDEKKQVEEKIDALEQVKGSEDKNEIQAAIDSLNQTFSVIAQRIYQQQSQTETQQEPSVEADTQNDEDVIDAEFEAEDEKEN